MIDPNLRRAVWLTQAQRDALLDAATRAYATEGADLFVCQTVVTEIQSLDTRLSVWHNKIRAVVKLLELPDDSLPVYISHREIEEIVIYGELDLDLADLIDPPIPQNIFYEGPRYE